MATMTVGTKWMKMVVHRHMASRVYSISLGVRMDNAVSKHFKNVTTGTIAETTVMKRIAVSVLIRLITSLLMVLIV